MSVGACCTRPLIYRGDGAWGRVAHARFNDRSAGFQPAFEIPYRLLYFTVYPRLLPCGVTLNSVSETR